MSPDLTVHVALLILTLSIFFLLLKLVPKRALNNIHSKTNRATLQSGRHLAQASHHLAQARSTPHRAQSQAHAKTALSEAEKALSLAPRDPSAHVLRAMALDLVDRKAAALRSLHVALSPPCVKSLAARERADALIKRAELKIEVNRRRRVDSAVQDLVEAVRIGGGEPRALGLLGQCYEWKGMRDEAREGYEKSLRVEPGSIVARQGLDRLGP